MGSIPAEQGYRETAHASRSERQHSNDGFYYQQESSRSQYSSQAADRSRSYLHHGVWISIWITDTIQQPVSIDSILCHTRQEQRQVPSAILEDQ